MREILFRGKRLNNGAWVFGQYVYQYGGHTIYLPSTDANGFDNYNINPESVGQYTGITDKNGKQIFEGDILKATIWSNGDLLTFAAVVQYANGEFGLKSIESPVVYHFCSICKTRSEVIGNIHDNPELLKDGERE